MLSDIKNSIKYDICKIRNRHTVNPEDLKIFLQNMKIRKETRCVDCGCLIELEYDEDDKSYWVREI